MSEMTRQGTGVGRGQGPGVGRGQSGSGEGQRGLSPLAGNMPTQGMQSGPGADRPRDRQRVFGRLTAYLRPHRGLIAVTTALVVASTGLALLGPYLVGLAIDRYIVGGDLTGLWRISLILLGTYTLYWLAEYGQSYTIVAVTQRVLRALRRDLFGHLQALSRGFVVNTGAVGW